MLFGKGVVFAESAAAEQPAQTHLLLLLLLLLAALSLSLHFLHLTQVGDQPYLWTFQAAAERARSDFSKSLIWTSSDDDGNQRRARAIIAIIVH